MNDPIFVFTTTETIGYITSQFIQGAVLSGVSVHTNSESLQCDGRFCGANLKKLSVGHRDQPLPSELVIVDENRPLSSLPDMGEGFLENLLRLSASTKLALIYGQDDVNFMPLPKQLLKFLPHQCRGFSKNPEAVPVPWGFTLEGFEASKLRLGRDRNPRKIIQNFNPTRSQSVREAVVAALQVTNIGGATLDSRHLHGEEYANQLADAQFCLAVGGAFHWPNSDFHFMRDRMDARSLSLDVFPDRSKTVGIVRWDSFRFWESMAFGCLPIQLDLDKHGFVLPHVPQGWLHYIPFDLGSIQDTVDKLNELARSPDLLRYMSDCAANWALEHAHPVSLYKWVIENVALGLS